MLKTSITLIITVIIVSCNSLSKKQLSVKEYSYWFEQNKETFEHEKTVGDYSFKLLFIPPEIKILTEVSNPNEIDEKYYQERLSELKNKIFCSFEITPINQTQTMLETETNNPTEYGSKLNYFISLAQQDFYIIQNKDTMRSLSYHFENTYGIKKSNTISMIFENRNSNGDIEFVFDDKVLNTGPIIFTQQSFNKTSIPQLKL